MSLDLDRRCGQHEKDNDLIKSVPEALEQTKKWLSENDHYVDNCRTELNTIHHTKIEIGNLQRCGSLPITEENDISCSTFLTTASRSFSNCAAFPPSPFSPSLASTYADLDEVDNVEHFDTADVKDPDRSVHFDPSGGTILESCSKNNFESSKYSATTNGRQLCESENERENENENGNLSWLSRSLCGMQSSSALENIYDESMGTSFHTAACMPSCSLKENIHNDQVRDNEERIRHKEKHSTCLVCAKDTHACDCLDNVFDCTYTEYTSCSTNDDGKRKNYRLATDEHNDTELAIGTFLDANGIWCNSWPEWYPDEDRNNLVVDSRDSVPVLEKRGRDLNTRRKRLERLRINLTPFSFLDEELDEGAINMERYKQGKWTRSLSDISPKSVLTPSTIMSKKASQMSFHWEAINCGEENSMNGGKDKMVHEMNALNFIRTVEDEDKCYDSDPSEMLCRQQYSPHLKLRKAARKSSESTRKELDCTAFFGKMHGLMNSRKTLVWHGNKDNSQVAVKAWIEPGSQLQSVLIQPKFMWQQTLGSGKRTTERRVLNKRIFHSVDLLDITKIVATERIDRKKYPFAKRSCSFVVQSFVREMVFEAVCEAERDDIVDGLKMMVARLGSKILVGDGQVLNEFFTPMGASVPGDLPTFASEGQFATLVEH